MSKAIEKLTAKMEDLKIKWNSYISGQNISFHSAEKGDEISGKIFFSEFLLMRKIEQKNQGPEKKSIFFWGINF